MSWIILLLIIFGNFWIWKIFNQNTWVFVSLVIVTFLLSSRKLSKRIPVFAGMTLILFSVILFYFQWKTTTPQSLTLLSNDEQRVHSERLKFYNPSVHYMRVLFKRLDLINSLEGDFNTASNRIQRNFFESIDPNIYFFAGHPRERIWANDFEKFFFLLVIPFLIGLYKLVTDKNWILIFYGLCCLILLSLIGHQDNLGPFILFPIIVLAILDGLLFFKRYVK